MTVAEAAARLGVSPRLVRRWCLKGQLSARISTGHWKIDERELERFSRIPRKVGRPARR